MRTWRSRLATFPSLAIPALPLVPLAPAAAGRPLVANVADPARVDADAGAEPLAIGGAATVIFHENECVNVMPPPELLRSSVTRAGVRNSCEVLSKVLIV
jgi:hypothetical protein